MTLIEPVDAIHADCLAERDAIRRQVATIRTGIAAWQPQPCPTDQNTRQTRSTR